MAYNDKVTTSKHGRRLGLQIMSSAATGGARGAEEYLVGPEAFRVHATTGDTTAANIRPYGVSLLATGSSNVFTIDPPIPGVSKTVHFAAGPTYLKTGGATFWSTFGSSHTTIKPSSSVGGSIELMGLTTASWILTLGGDAASFTLSTST
jgi:hypothetical protein